jgi:hypothetical protein
VLPTPTDGLFTASFPSNVEIDDGNAYQVQSTEGQLTGKYRVEHDRVRRARELRLTRPSTAAVAVDARTRRTFR